MNNKCTELLHFRTRLSVATLRPNLQKPGASRHAARGTHDIWCTTTACTMSSLTLLAMARPVGIPCAIWRIGLRITTVIVARYIICISILYTHLHTRQKNTNTTTTTRCYGNDASACVAIQTFVLNSIWGLGLVLVLVVVMVQNVVYYMAL